MRIILLILVSLALASCLTKPVETVYYENKDLTSFTTRDFKVQKRGKEIKLVAMKECPGKVICKKKYIKLTITHSDRFTFLKGKDLDLETDEGKINLNERDYSTSYGIFDKSKVGTSGVLNEKFLVWVPVVDFRKAAYSENSTLLVGDFSFVLSNEGRVPWQILVDKERILEIMDEEQRREYGQYQHENKEKKEQDVRTKRIALEAEESTWDLVKDSKDPEEIQYFLEQFPNSPYAVPAKLKLKQLEK